MKISCILLNQLVKLISQIYRGTLMFLSIWMPLQKNKKNGHSTTGTVSHTKIPLIRYGNIEQERQRLLNYYEKCNTWTKHLFTHFCWQNTFLGSQAILQPRTSTGYFSSQP